MTGKSGAAAIIEQKFLPKEYGVKHELLQGPGNDCSLALTSAKTVNLFFAGNTQKLLTFFFRRMNIFKRQLGLHWKLVHHS